MGNKNKKRKSPEAAQYRAAAIADDITAFEEFRREVLPLLRADLKNGLSHKELRKKYMALLEARKISLGLASLQEGVALSAIKDVQDRHEGRSTEKREVVHKYENMPERELDAILQSETEDLKGILN